MKGASGACIHHTLGETGVKSLAIRGTVQDDLRVTVELVVKNKADVEKIAKGFDDLKQSLKQAATQMPKLAVLVQMLDGVQIQRSGQSITFEGLADEKAIQGILEVMF